MMNIKMLKMLKMAFAGLLLTVSGLANAALISWDLSDPDSGFEATFVYDDDTLNGAANNSDLFSITGDFGDGIFTYLFNSTSSSSPLIYDVTDLSLIRWVGRGAAISSTNASASGTLSYIHSWYDKSNFILGSYSIVADWNGAAIGDGNLTDLNVQSQTVPEPSTLAIFALGMIGLASRRFKKQS